jgi:hypothetical protein
VQFIKELLFLLLAVQDAGFTEKRIMKYGVSVELTPGIRWWIRKLGVRKGISFGILIPTGILMGLGWFYPEFLAFLLGIRFCLFFFQQYSERFYVRIKR